MYSAIKGSLSEQEIEIIQKTWENVLAKSADVAVIFYNRLFFLEPRLRPLFKEDIRTQAKKFLAYLAFIINNLHDLQGIETELKALGKRHVNYEVKADDYNNVAEALLYTLNKLLPGTWNEDSKNAWVKMYTILTEAMLAGTHSDSKV